MKPDKPHTIKIGIQATRAEWDFIWSWLDTRQRTEVLLLEARRMKGLDAASRKEMAEQHDWNPRRCPKCGAAQADDATECMWCAHD